MKNSVCAALLLVATLAFAGCTSGTPQASDAAGALPVSAETVQVAAADERQAWADNIMGFYQDAASESAPKNAIKSWSSPKPGVLNVVIGNGEWQKYDLMFLGDDIMIHVGPYVPELHSVYASTEDESLTFDFMRAMSAGLI